MNKTVKKARKAIVRYSASLMSSIIKRVANGSALAHVLKKPNMPHYDTFYDWLKKYPHHAKEYEEAVRCRLEYMIDEMLNEPEPTEEELSNPIFYSKMRDRRQKGLMWTLEKIHRQKYGNHISIENKHTLDLKPILNRIEQSMKEKGLKAVGGVELPETGHKKPERLTEIPKAHKDDNNTILHKK
ncbi:hypothetical protein [Candidatus Liberibacter americanus]|uniref:Uncharacterized protein n=1 Tax=Candidatus Liberibacter americanus str. Sao Paulo TaxID=1261131 RepID=U6B4L8_9HYPH|nr:hypothetical protein [Candidatus Liberibacter americanus]AHA28014.1 hypothetical protein lam_668 [Candidatus Liberibacter americanus str. Sao Paulo]EMS35832.1 hypothetical protein G653_04696 [Candidatus Liberibacter americanus PW_SP]